MPTIKQRSDFSKLPLNGIEQMRDDPDLRGVYADTRVRGLLLRVGRRRVSFVYEHDTTIEGARVRTAKLLGHFEKGVFGVNEARREAEKEAGRVAGGSVRSRQVFEDAFAEYVSMLKRRRSPKWCEIVEGIGKNHLLPRWGTWRLDKLSKSPRLVREWHAELTRDCGPSAANHAAKVLRTVYMHTAQEDDALRRDRHPCTSVEFNEEVPREIGIENWREWRKAWDKVQNPNRKAYHLLALLTGCRPGEIARVKWDGFNTARRTLTIRKSKSGLDIAIPLSQPIIGALRMAGTRKGYIFPARNQGHITRFDSDGLPRYANHLRHTYSTVAKGLGFDDGMVDMLTVHQPRGVSQRYFVRLILSSMSGMRKAQARISAEIVRRLGTTLLSTGARAD